ncbi:MAG: aspartate--tRNA ligase [Patescibacteria group bacterium]|nr:aspartate--tRNA ligase [Patescibacteria group bacterium]MDD5490217.1 aspartate--tRNA ligase [Patescibacteria group bacterium]
MERTLTKETIKKVGERVLIKGWVHSRRNLGKFTFIDLRDKEGLVQVIFIPSEMESGQDLVKDIRSEFVLSIEGMVQKRGPKQINPNLATGEIEILAKNLEILSTAETPPFEVDKDTREISEELRLKYRYLDLRSERMKNNLVLRSKLTHFFLQWLERKGFLYVETPYLTKGTPEGAREYILPSRLFPGEFYVLPQSPQQFKQLLMVAGAERYCQLARCFRDEDQRGDRQPEFTQIDLEMSFVEQEDILKLAEELVIELIKTLCPGKPILSTPFPRLTYKETIEKYNTDKPDLRQDKNNPDELAFAWVVDFPLFEYSAEEKKLVSCHHPFTSPKKEDEPLLESDPVKVKAEAYDLVLNGFEIAGGSIRIHSRELQNKIFKILGLDDEKITERFGHLLEAFKYGVPPHGGIAFGFDRLLMLLAGEPNIREVIPFPKTSDAKDLMMGAPSALEEERLKEAHIKLIKKDLKK